MTTPLQSDWEEKLQQVRLQFVTADDEADRIEVWEKEVLPLLATSQQETLKRVVEKVEGQRARWVETKNSPVDPEQIKGFYNAAIDNALTAIKSTLQETR